MKNKCSECHYWHQITEETGQCRLNPPSVITTNDTCDAAWPHTRPDQWCGQWAPIGEIKFDDR